MIFDLNNLICYTKFSRVSLSELYSNRWSFSIFPTLICTFMNNNGNISNFLWHIAEILNVQIYWWTQMVWLNLQILGLRRSTNYFLLFTYYCLVVSLFNLNAFLVFKIAIPLCQNIFIHFAGHQVEWLEILQGNCILDGSWGLSRDVLVT